ncbi:2'-5' RNA ligase [Aquimarina sp. MMG015]|uniref:RNA ligase family protein n=1 Tax=Aquimarina sp. MMG015 TaxID=2822689 RepID=UPI001B3A28D4|nr:RNA ligase family protein [Aquimarina sp. MMG015]MBQ4801528.1 2'-5' RNA ligase [Aquimarina sp. MMG015]
MIESFSGYEKTAKNLKGFDANDFKSLDKLDWVVTEKIHGANFSFIYENRELTFAKRKELLTWKSDFFGFQLVVKQIESNILELFEELSLQYKATRYIIYGELFGGIYPHENVTPDKRVQAIQTGVYYDPSINFFAFDIAIISDAKYYLSYKESITYFEKYNISFVKPLFVGKLSEALNFNISINSKIPQELNLPNISDNLIEGIIVKPYDYTISVNKRPVVKIKNNKFEEENKFHQAKKWAFTENTNSYTEELSFLIAEIRNYLTKNRLDSAISKIGAVDHNKKQRISELENEFLEDTLLDFNLDNNEILEGIDKAEQKWVIDRIRADIRQLIEDFRRE